MKKIIVAALALGALAAPAHAQAAYLYEGEARLLTKRMALKLAPQLGADYWAITRCDRVSRTGVVCRLTFRLTRDGLREECRYRSYVRKTRNAAGSLTMARAVPTACVEAQ